MKDRRNIHILLIEDNEEDQFILAELFSDMQGGPYSITWKRTYNEGLTALKSNRFDLCLLDYLIGPDSGLQLLAESQKANCATPVIFLTGLGDRTLDLKAMAAGASEFLDKSNLSIEILDRTIRYTIRHSAALQALKMSEAALRQAKERAEEMTRLKSSFLANMSHEIRTPLTAILGFAEILVDDSPAEIKPIAEIISKSGNRLLETINSVLAISQIEAKGQNIDLELISINKTIAERVSLFDGQAQEKGIKLNYVATENEICLETNPSVLGRILDNLLSNALKFTFEGEVRIQTIITTDNMGFSVSDTGVGISDDFLPFIYDEFRQESSGFARTHEGSGLGMSITKRLVEILDGEILINTIKDKGTKFTVLFPIENASIKSAKKTEAHSA